MDSLTIRPAVRTLGVQMLVYLGLGLGASALLGVGLFAARNPKIPILLALILLLGAVGFAFAQALWFDLRAPRSISPTAKSLEIVERSGQETRVLWASIQEAAHGPSVLGMRWKLTLHNGEVVVLRDIGIDNGHWGLLWMAVVNLAAGHGARVWIDRLSSRMYADFQKPQEPPKSLTHTAAR